MQWHRIPGAAVVVATLVALMGGSAHANPVVTSGSGATPAALAPTVDAFRTQLGAPNVGGPTPTGRRDITWDGVPDTLAAPATLPFDFFNTTVPRGALLATPGGTAAITQVSANTVNPTRTPVRFGNIDPTYPTLFQAFSPERIFNSSARPLDVVFRVPGTPVAGATSGFGAVFTSVSIPNSTIIQYFDANGRDLGSFFAPTGPLSFLGVRFDQGEQVALVRIQQGNAPLAPRVTDGGAVDVVAMDDFVFGEPQPVASSGESFETGLDGFTPSRLAGLATDATWTQTTTDSHSGAGSAFVPDAAHVTDMALTSPAVSVPAGRTSRLTFFQRIGSEPGFDGGRLEISQDAGATWAPAPPGQFVENPPTVRLLGPTNPLFGQPAWSGPSPGFVRTIFDLTPYAGRSILYRFRFGTDNSVSARGWLIDDVAVETPAPTPPGGTPPGGQPPGTRPPTTRPGAARITALSLTPSALRVGGKATLRFTLTAPSTVRVTIAQLARGRVSRGRCRVGATRGRRCRTFVTIAAVNLSGRRGTNAVGFNGRIGGRALATGIYRITARVGASSRTATFTILRARRARR